jgi:hypothetical protein
MKNKKKKKYFLFSGEFEDFIFATRQLNYRKFTDDQKKQEYA